MDEKGEGRRGRGVRVIMVKVIAVTVIKSDYHHHQHYRSGSVYDTDGG